MNKYLFLRPDFDATIIVQALSVENALKIANEILLENRIIGFEFKNKDANCLVSDTMERAVFYNVGHNLHIQYDKELMTSNALKRTIKSKFQAPFRIGRKQQRAVLDANGREVVVFRKGDEAMAMRVVELLNLSERK